MATFEKLVAHLTNITGKEVYLSPPFQDGRSSENELTIVCRFLCARIDQLEEQLAKLTP